MNADEARKKMSKGAIKSIESLIGDATDKGWKEVYIPEGIEFNEEVRGHFESNGYNVSSDTIRWG